VLVTVGSVTDRPTNICLQVQKVHFQETRPPVASYSDKVSWLNKKPKITTLKSLSSTSICLQPGINGWTAKATVPLISKWFPGDVSEDYQPDKILWKLAIRTVGGCVVWPFGYSHRAAAVKVTHGSNGGPNKDDACR